MRLFLVNLYTLQPFQTHFHIAVFVGNNINGNVSGFRKWLILDNLFLTVGSDSAALFLIDFKAVFNMVNHTIIIDCLEHRASVNSTALA